MTVTGAATTQWANRIRGGDLRALARAATAVENRAPDAEDLLKELFPHTGKAFILGITGAPGAGKSTLVNQMARVFRAQARSVGIISVDPSSPFTGGAILGDRIRMQDHHADPGVFIRSMATRGWLGGLAQSTFEMTTLLDAAGRDLILVETVGVGQAEIEIARLAHVTLLVLAPGMGDDVQTLKAGIMEIADVFVINKADHPGAERLEKEIRSSLSLGTRAEDWTPPVVRTVATEGTGVEEALAQASRCLESKRRDPNHAVSLWSRRLREMLRERLLESVPPDLCDRLAAEVAARRADPYSALNEMIQSVRHA